MKKKELSNRIDLLNDRIYRAERAATTGLINNKNVRNQQIAELSQRVDLLIRVFDQMDIRLAKLEQVKQKDDDLNCRLTLVEAALKNEAIREKAFGVPKKSATARTKRLGKPKKSATRSKR